MVIDDNGDREPEYWLWGLGLGMKESQPFGLVPVKFDDEGEVYKCIPFKHVCCR